ncbi:MAG TPA: DNA adenine methylase, partial [Segetibacter sp.]
MPPSKKTNSKQRPLIKWTGGKYEEFSEFAELIPTFENYYEPFFGGGGVFFALQPNGSAFLNDKSADLISFYRLLQNEEFKIQLEMYASAWEQVTDLSTLLIQKLIEAFEQLISGAIYKDTLEKIVLTSIREIDERKYFSLFDSAFIIDVAAFKTVLVKSLTDKCRRIYNIQLA